MTRFFSVILCVIVMVAPAARAQQGDAVWVQIEAQPSLSSANDRIRDYSTQLDDVHGFSLGAGWYAIALGPYAPEDADRILRSLRAQGLIPRDSYVARSSDYQQQFWPIGTNALDRPALEIVDPILSQNTSLAQDTPIEIPLIEPADETPAEARASESLLSRDERAALQEALRWAGFYAGPIDAAFGRGTRASMADWQAANGHDETGILTTLQRAELLGQYNAVLDGLGLQIVRDEAAGIEIEMPTALVAFERYEPPFVHYNAQGDIDARVLLISQTGTDATLAGLYDIMQTLEIVPETGPRTLESDAFTLIGEGALTISHTQAWLKDGEIKGFTLVWPAGDEERRTRLLGRMQESFTRIDGVLDPAEGSDAMQGIDLVSGLEIRKPRLNRSGFYVDRTGAVLTTADVVDGCRRITIDEDHEAEVARRDDSLGIALLRPLDRLAPMAVAAFQQAIPRLRSDVAVAGYSYGGVLGAPTLTFGQLEELQGLNGEDKIKRLSLHALEGDAGGPVVDAGGAVLGMLMPQGSGDRRLPDGVSFAANNTVLKQLLQDAGITPSATSEIGQMAPEALTDRAAGMTVLVSCWD
jgi:S1-C subfamily serine protease